MFHLELRQFPHVARVFNLTREDLDARFARPWVSGSTIEHDDRRWAPERAKLTIYEGPELRTDEIGMGRGWPTVGKTSQDVTETVLAEAQRGSEARSAVHTFKAVVAGGGAYSAHVRRADRAGRRASTRSGGPASSWRWPNRPCGRCSTRASYGSAGSTVRSRGTAGSRSC